MSRIDWTAIAIKFFSVFLMFGNLVSAANIAMFYLSAPFHVTKELMNAAYIVPTSLAIFVPIVACMILWRKALPLARWIWRGDDEQQEEKQFSVPASSKQKLQYSLGLVSLCL